MSVENENECSKERRCSTTVLMTNNFVVMSETEGEEIQRNGSVRRRLSKQHTTIEEPTSSVSGGNSSSNSISEIPPIAEEKPTIKHEETISRQRLQREDAIVGDDDTKLRPPTLLKKPSWSLSKSLSRDSTGTDYSDRIGTDLRQFIRRTLHKSEEDRSQLLLFEKELMSLVEDEQIQSKKFELPSSYHRMLLHRCAAWFGLDHNVTNKQTEVVVNKSEKTKKNDERFEDFIMNDEFIEGKFCPKNKYQQQQQQQQQPNGMRPAMQHKGSFNSDAAYAHYESQGSLNGDLLMMRRAQSFDITQQPVQNIQYQVPTQEVRCLPMRQLSLQCPQKAFVPAPMSGPQFTQWQPQRSFDCGHHSPRGAQNYFYTTRRAPLMRKAESFGGMDNSVFVETPYHCPTPPNMIIPQNPGFHICEEDVDQQPIYHQDPVEIIEYGPVYYQPVKCAMVPQDYVQPHIQQRQYRIAPQNQVYYHQQPQPQYVPYPTNQTQYYGFNPEVVVDPIVTQPFPPVGHFTAPPDGEQDDARFKHQTATANKFIKTSIDGGYGSMNQENEVPKEPEAVLPPTEEKN